MDPLDPRRAANLLIRQHGAAAKLHAIQRVLDMQHVGDARGEQEWMAVLDAVLDLHRDRTSAPRAERRNWLQARSL